MIKFFTNSLFALALFFFSGTLKAQIYWNFDTPAPTTSSYPNITVDSLSVVNNFGTSVIRTTTSVSSGYTGASGNFNAGAAVASAGFNVNTSTYFQTTLTPTSGTSVVLTGISFGARATTTGPLAVTIRTSLDNFATDQATFTIANNSTWSLYASNTLNAAGPVGVPVVIRIYAFNGTNAQSGTVNFRIDDLTLNPTSLPLTLTAFSASFNGNASQLKWASVNEINVKGFSVEKSLNGTNFSEIAFVKGQNNVLQNLYSVNDVDVKSGINYYRLKMVNNDGSVKYSNTVLIANRLSLRPTVFPNPAISNLSVSHDKAGLGAAIRLMTLDGKLIKTMSVQAGAVQTGFSVNELVKGNYLLIFENNGEKTTTQFSKQ
jgi:hypothetical protein